jgi:hypothetical protein
MMRSKSRGYGCVKDLTMMANILPFPPKPDPQRKPRRSASRGVSFTLRVDAKEIAEELKKQIGECEDNQWDASDALPSKPDPPRPRRRLSADEAEALAKEVATRIVKEGKGKARP